MVTNYGVIKRRQSEMKTDSSISFCENTGDTVNPLLSLEGAGGGGAYLFQSRLRRGLFNLEKTLVSVLHKELEYQVEKLKYKKVGGQAAEDQNQIRTSSW